MFTSTTEAISALLEHKDRFWCRFCEKALLFLFPVQIIRITKVALSLLTDILTFICLRRGYISYELASRTVRS
jgi:hypothetical protein